MSDRQTNERLDELETRNAHQELALETMTQTLLELEKTVAAQAERLRRLETQLRGLQPDGGGQTPLDERPPHY